MNTNNNIPYVIKTNGSVTLYLKGECLTVATDHPNYNKIIDNIKAGDFSNIETLVNVAKAVINYASGRISILNGEILYNGFAVHNTLTNRILKMMNEGFKFDHMIKFLDNLMQNPSKRSVDETYWFLENYGLPITDDGCFLAYKAVRNNYTDIYSGKFFNGIGGVVSMPRNMVDDNYGVDCSKGLHVGALDYVVGYGHFTKGQPVAEGGNRLLLVKVNPKDVVSVPKYDGHTKMRVCEYVVVSEIKDVVKELDKVVYTSKAEEIQPDNDDWDDGDWEDEDFDNDPNDGLSVSNKDTVLWDGNEAYDAGFNTGRNDRSDGAEYGHSRDYGLKGDYLKGYNDGYNNRQYNAPADSGSCCGCGSCDDSQNQEKQADSDEFNAGYTLGQFDYNNHRAHSYSLEGDDSVLFRDGYYAGYNDAQNNSKSN